MFEIDTPKIRAALQFATVAHINDRRKYTDEMYIAHPIAVTTLIGRVTADESVYCAALLHDVVEDTLVEHDTILTLFGERVARLVKEVTNVAKKSDGNRETRFKINLDHLKNACSDSQSIKLADIIDNIKSIALLNPSFAVTYIREKQQVVEVLGRGDAHLYDTVNILIENYRKLNPNAFEGGHKV